MPIKPRVNNDGKIAIRQIKIQGKKYKGDIIVAVELLSHAQLIHEPMDSNLPGSSVHRISQARLLEWVVTSFSREIFLSQGSNLHILFGRQVLYYWATWEAHKEDTVDYFIMRKICSKKNAPFHEASHANGKQKMKHRHTSVNF